MPDLVGQYGDLFIDLPPTIAYAPGTELVCDIYVANPTDVDREYMMMITVATVEGKALAEYPIKVDNGLRFVVEAHNVLGLPGAIACEYTDAVATFNLYEREFGGITDSTSVVLVSAGTDLSTPAPALPFLPAPSTTTPGFDWSGIISIMAMAMMMGMMLTMTRGMFGEKQRE